MSDRLIAAIKMAAGTYRQDIVSYYVCEVLPQDDGTQYNQDDLTIRVQIISGKSVSNLGSITQPIESVTGATVSVINTFANYTTDEQLSNMVNQMLPDTILDNVQLMTGVDDGILNVPSIGSHVVVMNSTYQNPFVVQYSNLDYQYISCNVNYEMNIGQVGSTNSIMFFTDSEINLSTGTSNQFSSIDLETNSIDLEIYNGANINLTTKFDITASNGAEITGDTLLSIKNTNASLVNIMNNIYTVLKDIAAVSIPSGGGNVGTIALASDPTFATKLAEITTDISNLLQ